LGTGGATITQRQLPPAAKRRQAKELKVALRALGFEPKKEELKKLVWLELILVCNICNISMKWWSGVSDVSDGYLLDISWLTPTRCLSSTPEDGRFPSKEPR